MILVDTSAVLAYFDARDPHHDPAVDWIRDATSRRQALMTHSHALGEMIALLQSRLGNAAVAGFVAEMQPLIETVWVGADLHDAGVQAMLAADRRRLSLVDCVSFVVMRSRGIDTAFAFDRDFAAQGFRTVPA